MEKHRQNSVISFEIENGKIVHHWLIADQMMLMEQLGVMNAPGKVLLRIKVKYSA